MSFDASEEMFCTAYDLELHTSLMPLAEEIRKGLVSRMPGLLNSGDLWAYDDPMGDLNLGEVLAQDPNQLRVYLDSGSDGCEWNLLVSVGGYWIDCRKDDQRELIWDGLSPEDYRSYCLFMIHEELRMIDEQLAILPDSTLDSPEGEEGDSNKTMRQVYEQRAVNLEVLITEMNHSEDPKTVVVPQ